MVKLVKIRRTDDYIETYYIPESSDEEGYIKMRLSDDEILDKRLTSYDDIIAWYFRYAYYKLKEIKNDPELPKERLVMWY